MKSEAPIFKLSGHVNGSVFRISIITPCGISFAQTQLRLDAISRSLQNGLVIKTAVFWWLRRMATYGTNIAQPWQNGLPLNLMNPRKSKSKQPFNLEAFFERVAEKIDPDIDVAAAMDKEPWPEWQNKLAGMMARTYAPELKASDLKERPWAFEGYETAAMFLLLKKLESLNFDAFSKTEMLGAIEKIYEGQGVLEIVPPEGLYAFTKESFAQTPAELEPVYEKIAEAARQSIKDAVDFFEAFGDGLKRRTGFNAVKRLSDSNIVRVCLFLISLRALIEANVFLTVSELIGYFHFQLDRKGETFSVSQENSRVAFDKQFRRICSAAGLKLAGRGRPRGGQF